MVQIDPASVLFQFKGTTAESHQVKILGIRGYDLSEHTGLVDDIYDDLICSVIGDQVLGFRASTHPGAYYIDHPLNPQGCARLTPGLWSYMVGLHHNSHEAFVQEDSVVVDRLSQDGTVHLTGDKGFFGLNIHSGGPEYEVGRFSAGCQIIFSPEGAWSDTWHQFFDPLKKALADFGQTTVPYLLVDSLKAMAA